MLICAELCCVDFCEVFGCVSASFFILGVGILIQGGLMFIVDFELSICTDFCNIVPD